MSEEIKRYALTESAERELLSSLPFVGKSQADFIRNTTNPIAKVRSELHRVYTTQMAAFDADILARVAARTAQPQRATQTEQQLALDRAFGLGEASTHAASYDAKTGVQSLGTPPRADAQRTADALASAFGDESPTRGGAPNPNVQTFGKASR